jgi:signal transduction histidine kinase
LSQSIPIGGDRSEPVVSNAAGNDGASAFIAARMWSRQVEILDGGVLSGAANVPAAIIAAFIMRSAVPAPWLYLWVGIVVATIGGLVGAMRGLLPWRTNSGRPEADLQRQLAIHICFATALGAIWGAVCLTLGPRLAQDQMMFLTVIILGCNAGCVTPLGPCLPAFFGYCIASLVPLSLINFLRPEPEAGYLTLLIVLFAAALVISARSLNRHVLAAFRLRAENEILAENVVRANAATVTEARKKWDTLAHLSHELRTPMTAVIGFSELMREQLFGPLGERYLGYSGHIHESGRRALDLIDAILEVSRAEAGQLLLTETEIAPSALVGECLHMVEIAATVKHLTLASHFGQPMPLVAGDQPKLRQALLNLLTNAIKYTPDGGQVSVATEMVDGGLDIAVADTGVGIAAGDLERCLEPFVRLGNPHTAGVEGVGLGLPLAKHLVEVHGGSLRIASELGRGTIVTIHVPPERCLAA